MMHFSQPVDACVEQPSFDECKVLRILAGEAAQQALRVGWARSCFHGYDIQAQCVICGGNTVLRVCVTRLTDAGPAVLMALEHSKQADSSWLQAA
jgi:hypothetical protein